MSTFWEGKRVLVTNGDVLTTLDQEKLLAFDRAHGDIATIAVQRRQVKIDLGMLQGDKHDCIDGYIEKPS
jgi:NDP-sugar pyrophosphorylase family protein